MDNQTRTELEAAAFRRIMSHLRKRTDVQNIDLMGLAGFCRNCFANWYLDAAAEKNIKMDKAQARETIYGMPYTQWVENHQTDATEEQMQKMDESLKKNKEM
jgi:hypothetical protein